MQNNDASLAPIPEPKNKQPQAEALRQVTDKNRVDTIARSSEPGRHGEESVYVPPSQLYPERSTAQTAFENSPAASAGGSYGLDHFMDKGSIAESAAARPLDSAPLKLRPRQLVESIKREPHLYALGAMVTGFLFGRFLPLASRA